MTRFSLTGNGAAAWGARLAMVNYIPTYPVTPQFEIIESLANWIAQGEMKGKLTTLETEAAMLSAAGNAVANGKRVFAATSGKYLLNAIEMLDIASGWRVPMVLINVPYNASAPTTLETDHNDVLAARDSGFLQIHCATCQEILDTVLLAHRFAEDDEVRLPVLIDQDGLSLPTKSEPVNIPNSTTAKQFIGSYEPAYPALSNTTLSNRGTYAAGIKQGAGFRYEMHLALQHSLTIYDELADEFRDFFGRSYPAVISYGCHDADYVFVLMGSIAARAEEAVNRLRENGWKVGLIRPRLLRPFPQEKFLSLLQGKRAVAVIDRHLSPGKGGVLHVEITAALYGQKDVPAIIASFILGPAIRDITTQDLFEMATILRKAVETGETPAPRPLLTQQIIADIKSL